MVELTCPRGPRPNKRPAGIPTEVVDPGYFDGDVAVQRGVATSIDVAETAAADPLFDDKATDTAPFRARAAIGGGRRRGRGRPGAGVACFAWRRPPRAEQASHFCHQPPPPTSSANRLAGIARPCVVPALRSTESSALDRERKPLRAGSRQRPSGPPGDRSLVSAASMVSTTARTRAATRHRAT